MAEKSLKISRRASKSELPNDSGLPHLKGHLNEATAPVGDILAPVQDSLGSHPHPDNCVTWRSPFTSLCFGFLICKMG